MFTDGQIIDTVTPRHGNIKVNITTLRAEPIWDPESHPGAWRAIWAYSAKRARRDHKTLAAQEARARAIVPARRAPRQHDSSRPEAPTARSTRPVWPAPNLWSASRAT